MEFFSAIVGSVVTEVTNCAISPIKNHIKYLFNLGNNVQSLNDEVSKLSARRGSIQHDVDKDKRKGNNIKSNVDSWLTTVNEKISNVEEVIQSYEQEAKKKCFVGLCPNLRARYKLSRKAEEEAKVVAELLKNGNFEEGISDRPAIQTIMTFSNKDFEAFESRRAVLNGIMDALMDASINIIGVHGMGGVGKTTLVKEVARQVKESNLFDSVVFATVAQTFNVEAIQNQIAEPLDLKFDEQIVELRACRLRERLKNEKILVVLDDIWERLDLDHVGIPSGDTQGGLKILLTSRHLNVLSNDMDSQKNFDISLLTGEEAWDLFHKMAGDCVQSRDLQDTAIKVAKKCGGLPIAIATVARALKNKRSSYEWENALRELERPSSTSFTRRTTREAYSAIQLSYQYLQNKEEKMTFLLCSLIGHNGCIEDLLRYTKGLGLYDGINKINEARNKVWSVVNTLKDSWLLLDSYDDKHFDIHDVVRDVAISIGSRDHIMFVQENDGELEKWSFENNLQKCEMIALRHPVQLECWDPSFFSFMAHDGSMTIPVGLSTQIQRLQVLRLSGMSLPVSINFLHNLQTLCLDRCTLEDIAVVGELKNLEILSLACSNIRALPKEMAQLTRLKLLDLSHCVILKIIPPNVLSSLLELEELYMEDSFARWEDKVVSNERRNASLEELYHLSNITTLDIVIPKGQIIPDWLLIKNLDRYRIFNGYNCFYDGFRSCKYSRILKFQFNTNTYPSRGMKILVKKAEYLHLKQLQGVKNVIAELHNEEDFPYLKKLHIESGSEVQFITTEGIGFSHLEYMTLKHLPQLISICSDGNTSQHGEGTSSALPLFNKQSTFPRLEEMELCDINIRRIWQRQLPETSYHPLLLTRLIIEDCDNLEHLLSPSVARCLVKLKDFEISRCKCLREIISKHEMEIQEDEQTTVICFPDLTSLKIMFLLNLIEFCSENCIIELPSLKVLKIQGCPKLQELISTEPKMQTLFSHKVAIPGEGTSSEALPLFNKQYAFPPLKELELCWTNVRRIWHSQLPEMSYCISNLTRLIVWTCDKLEHLFSPCVAICLQQLKQFEIEGCKCLREIISIQDMEIEVNKDIKAVICFPQLISLKIKNLRDLTKLCSGNYTIEFPLLKELKIEKCPKLQEFISSEPKAQALFNKKNELVEGSFFKLEEMRVEDCGELLTVFPSNISFRVFQNLKKLSVQRCNSLEVIFEIAEETHIMWEGLNSEDLTFRFPQLASFCVKDLKQLKSLCGGEGRHAIVFEWPMLKRLDTDYSTLVKMVSSLNQEMNEEVQSVSHPFFFPQQVIVPKLEELCLSNFKDVESATFPISLLQRFNSLESLQLSHCDFEDVVDVVDAGITKLKLVYCQNLKLLSSSPSSCFQNLTTLEVFGCKMMINLVTASVAQNLGQLTTMRIIGCKAMTQIVAKEGDDEDGSTSIIFSKLKSIHLEKLQSLTSFCGSLSYTFKFPILEECIVDRCPSMKVFCNGVLSTPRLLRVRDNWGFDDGKGHWGGELNTTIKQMYAKKARYAKELKLSDKYPKLMKKWNERKPQQYFNFTWMRKIVFCGCSSLEYGFTFSMILSLKNLRKLEVQECINMEQVILDECHEMEETTYNDIVQWKTLNTLKIKSCANLQSFYLGSDALQFPNIETMEIKDCPKMMRFISSEKKMRDVYAGSVDLNIEAFFQDKVECHQLQLLKLSSLNIHKIWSDQLQPSSLVQLEVESCHNLKYLFPSLMVREFVKLSYLYIWDCESLEEVISMEGLTEEESMSFPRLEKLILKQLPKLTTLCSQNNLEVDKPAFFNEKVVFPSLEELTINGIGNCKKIWLEQLSVNSFCELKDIEIESCAMLVNIFPFNMKERLTRLEKLQIVNCGSVEEIFESQTVVATQSIVTETVTKFMFPRVTHLQFDKLPNLKSFYSRKHVAEWPSLKTIDVTGCSKVEIFVSECHSFGETLGQSQSDISNVQQPLFWVNQFDEVHDDERHASTLSGLVILRLSELPELTHLWNEPFRQTSILCNLNILEVLDCGKLKTLVPCWVSFKNLMTLTVSGCDGFINLIACSVAKSMVLLKEMSISDCKMIQEIIACQCDNKEGTIIFSQLKHLELSDLPNLSSFCLGDHSFEFPALTKVIVEKWPKMENFIFEREYRVIQRSYGGDLSTKRLKEVQLTGDSEEKGRCEGDLKTTVKQLCREKSKFPHLEELEMHYINVRIRRILLSHLPETSSCISNLTRLIIERCNNLDLLLSPSIARCLVQLRDFEIRNCKSLREIISKQEMEIEEDEQKVGICFPRLAYLKMKDLPNLIEFCSENCTIELPSLIELEIQDCPELHELVSSEPKMQALFNQKVAIPSLEWMILSNLRNVKTIFHNELLKDSFCKLEEMTVEDCDELLTVFPSNISFRVFQNLEKLEVISCDSLESIFEVGEEMSVVKSQLIDLSIVSAPKLKQIWNRDPQESVIFQSLSSVGVWRCESLKHVFPASIAKDLPQLEYLSIDDCGVEEIVWEGEELNLWEQSLPLTFNFPQLSNLELRFLEQLKCFYGNRGKLKHIVELEWPMLKSLEIDYSTLQKIVASQHQQMNEEAQSLSHPFCFLQQVIPKLEELCLSDVKNVECGSSLQIFHSLESLQLYECDFKDVGVVDTGTLSRIQKLELSCCLNLKQLGLNFGFSASSSSSSSCFQNLTTLEVHMCEMMVNLVTASVAQNLVQLTTMEIRGCIAMTEIVENEGDEDGSTSVIFSKLKSLDLCDLPSLTNFCSGNYTFNFPSLEELTIRGCPNLKLFCHGALSTPFLKMVTKWKYDSEEEDWDGEEEHIDGDEEDWDGEEEHWDGEEEDWDSEEEHWVADKEQWTGDLNSTIKQMYTEKVGYGDLEILKLSEKFPELMEIWNGKNPQQYFYFMALEIIELCECSSLKYGFTSSIAFSLNNLERLEVKKCINMKQVIWDECDKVEENTYKDGMFSKLEILKIESCANLQSFYLGSSILQFSKLETIRIFDCPKIMRFTSTEEKISDTNHECHNRSGTGKMLHQGDLNIKPFFNKKVVLPSLKELEINGIRDCKKIWHEQLSLYSFCKLKKVEIESCAMLLNIFPFNMMERLARLEKLHIVNCDSLEEIFELEAIATTQSIATETVTKFMLPRVTYLRFDKLSNLKSFYSRKHATEWPSLKTMEVSDCPKVEIFASECLSIGEIQEQSQIDISNVQQPLFRVNEVTFPILEELRLKQNDTMKGTWFEQLLPTVCFKNLKVIELSCIPDKLTALSYCFIKALSDLETLTLSEAPFCEIFRSEEVDDDERHASTFSRLIELRLSKLPELTHLWTEQFQPTPVLYNLNILEVLDCGKLKTLIPCWISFKNLRKLKVSGCDGIMNLIACSAAKSMIFLTEMSISDCKMIKEIIACECDDKEGSIIFSQLNCLQLSNLPTLSSFCLGNHSFEFLALSNLIVRECPTMENFCPGDLNTPKLKKLSLTADEERWEGDLKTTLKHLFREMNVQISEVTEGTP